MFHNIKDRPDLTNAWELSRGAGPRTHLGDFTEQPHHTPQSALKGLTSILFSSTSIFLIISPGKLLYTSLLDSTSVRVARYRKPRATSGSLCARWRLERLRLSKYFIFFDTDSFLSYLDRLVEYSESSCLPTPERFCPPGNPRTESQTWTIPTRWSWNDTAYSPSHLLSSARPLLENATEQLR